MSSYQKIIQKPKVLISILNWKNYTDTINCVEQLLKFEYNSCEILVIDNASHNNSVVEINKAYPTIKILQSPVNNGFAAGHKIAVKYALKNNFDLLWILNPDVILNKNTLPELIEAYIRNGDAIYGSVSIHENDPYKIEFGGAFEIKNGKLNTVYDFQKNKNISKIQRSSENLQVGSVEGFSMLIPLPVIRKHGFMNTTFFMYGEEVDYCLGLQSKGVPSYIVTNSIIIHKGEGSFQKSNGTAEIIAYYRARNFRLIAKKYLGLNNFKILKSVGGITSLVGFFIKWHFAEKNFRKKKSIDYFHNLGILHALMGIKGKKISPEKFI